MLMDPDIRRLMSGKGVHGQGQPPVPNAMSLNSYRFDEFEHGTSDSFWYGNGNTGFSMSDPTMRRDLGFSEIVSDISLTYITKVIMEENVEDTRYMHQGESPLFCAEKSPFEMIGNENSATIGTEPLVSPEVSSGDSGGIGPDSSDSGGGNGQELANDLLACPEISSGDFGGLGTNSSAYRVGQDWEAHDWVKNLFVSPQHPTQVTNRSPRSSFSSLSGNSNETLDLIDEVQLSTGSFPDVFLGNDPLWQGQFKKGMEEANKFLPEINKLIIDVESSGVSEAMVENKGKDGKVEERPPEPRGRKNSSNKDLDLEEGRCAKQSASHEEEASRSEMFDEVLLLKNGTCTDTIYALIEKLKNEANQITKGSDLKNSNRGRSRSKKQGTKAVVDLRTLLIHCAQSVAADDRRNANELLKQIRQHCNGSGDAMQKLALIFANGLEARLGGTGSQIYRSLMTKKQSSVDYLKAYRLYIAACPFRRVSHFFANQTILNLANNAVTLHIVDYGINYGFQWPCLIQQLSMARPGRPVNLRITGIDVPLPGFRPTERVDETGRRLADYCRMFNVPFEYHAVASKLEDVRIEDLKLRKDEVLVVNCLYRFKNLADESVFVDSPKDIVLNTIRKMNPDVFIHCVINGSYGAPFFVTRFREALFFYSSLFDMLETTIPRDHPEKILIENVIFGREAINVVACEGSEREERPETYRQWQVRSLRAGFKQLPLNPEILKVAKDKVRSSYHKDFNIEEDGRWLLQGWKGRIIHALSTWIPTAKVF